MPFKFNNKSKQQQLESSSSITVNEQQQHHDLDAEIPIHLEEQTTIIHNPLPIPTLESINNIQNREALESEVIEAILRQHPQILSDPQVIDELTDQIPGRKNRREAKRVLVRLANHLEEYAKQIEKYGDNMSESTKKVNIDILEGDLRALWCIIFNCGLFLGLLLLFLGIPGLVVLLVTVVAGLTGEVTARQQAYVIVNQILPMLRGIIRALSFTSKAPFRVTAKSLKLFHKSN
jgi:hypothetical protein